MKIIKPSVQFFGAVPTDYTNALRFIEMAGRTCYKSEDKITADSAEGFVKRLIKAGHLAMVEHGNFVVRCPADGWSSENIDDLICTAGKYLTVHITHEWLCVGGNLTAWYNRISDFYEGVIPHLFSPVILRYGDLFGNPRDAEEGGAWQVCPHNEIPKALHRYSAKFICDRGVSHELVRHRPCSFAQESTRYVNYGGKDMEFIEPWWMAEENEATAKNCHFGQAKVFGKSCIGAEYDYNEMLKYHASPQAARAVLPNALKTEIVVTADAAEWVHIKKLRTHPSAHPDMVRIMNMMPWEEMGL